MSKAITISGSVYTVTGTVKNIANNEGVEDLHVITYDKDIIGDDFLGIGVTNKQGEFTVSFDASKFKSFTDREPDLYFVVEDGGFELLDTKSTVIENANSSTPPINLLVDLTDDKLRKLINPTPVDGWVGGFAQVKPEFAYPNPNLDALVLQDNMVNIDKLVRQQKVVWPEFSWETEQGNKDSRCYQMFAPDISRLGYNSLGRVFSIVCPQQGASSPTLGSFNVEVTVTGNRGWADETTKEIAADMSVAGKIWFAPSAHENKFVKLIGEYFKKHNLPFPFSKSNAIVIPTSLKGDVGQPMFPLTKGASSDFPIPDFAKHEGISWSLAHLDVQIGGVEPTGVKVVDDFNQLILDLFNIASGNMLQKGNTLSWNVWFTAPELVNQQEWQDHAEKWRKSIDVDNMSPDGPGGKARYFDGTPFSPLKGILTEELPKVVTFIKEHIKE